MSAGSESVDELNENKGQCARITQVRFNVRY